MAEVGIRDLKARASEILRDVRDKRARYVVTYRGKPVGLLLPLPETPGESPARDDAWARLRQVGEEVSSRWRSPRSSDEILSDMRE